MMSRKLIVRIAEAEHEGIYVISVQGQITLGEGGEALERLISTKISEGIRQLIVDLRETTVMDSSGLGGLAKGLSRIKLRTGMAIVLPSRRVNEIFTITKMNTFFDLSTTLEEAMARIQSTEARSVPNLEFQEKYSVYRIGDGKDATYERVDEIGPRPVVHAPTESGSVQNPVLSPPNSEGRPFPLFAIIVTTGMGIAIFGSIIVGLVWVARQIDSPWALSLIFAVALLFSINIVVFVLVVAGFLSEKSTEKLLNGILGKVPGLKVWLPGVASRKAPLA